MDRPLHLALVGWGNFYLITGTAAAALTGLQFVVQSLLASDLQRAIDAGDPEGGIAAFGTPTVVHFTIAVALSCLMSMPWPAPLGLQLTLGLLGAGALLYAGIVLWRAQRQQAYTPVGEDWLWHVALPAASYTGVLVASPLLGHGTTGSLFAIAAATLVLLCVGIHNAWDTIIYLSVSIMRSSRSEQSHGSMAAAPASTLHVTTRPAQAADLPALGRLGASLVRMHHELDSKRFIPATAETEEGYAGFLGTQLHKPDVVMLVAERDGQAIGYVWGGLEGMDYMALRGPAGALYDIVVDPHYRGRGVGRLLLGAALSALAEKGAPRVVLSTAEQNEAAQRLFTRAGFRRTMVEMTREL